jgi:hypothetical protein
MIGSAPVTSDRMGNPQLRTWTRRVRTFINGSFIKDSCDEHKANDRNESPKHRVRLLSFPSTRWRSQIAAGQVSDAGTRFCALLSVFRTGRSGGHEC